MLRPMQVAVAACATFAVAAGALAPGAGAGNAVKVSCYQHADPSASAQLRVAPARCGLVPKDPSVGAGADVRRLDWTGWGTARTTGHGVVFLAAGVTLKAKVTLTRPHRRSCGRVYTRVKIKLEGGASRGAALKNC